MAGTITLTCGQCKKVMQVPEVLAGKRIRCRGCEATLTVKKPVPQTAPVKSAAGSNDEWAPAQAYGIERPDDQLRCAFCAVDMEDGQIVCLNCGYNMQTRERHGTRVVHPQTGVDYTLWHLPTFLCFLVILGCIACLVIIWTGRPYMSGFMGETFQDWRWGRVYASAFLAFIIFSAGRFVYKRLIHQLHPPEIEKHAHEEHKVDD
ncbi:MAG: hypothetical protein JNJ77_13705 [Planctomycetia bacterium]|nr:hypothetical protein [Planctomycetia bacterium]